MTTVAIMKANNSINTTPGAKAIAIVLVLVEHMN